MRDSVSVGAVPAEDVGRQEGPARRLWDLWRRGERPDVQAFLAESAELTPVQVVGVLRVDQRERWLLGEHILAEAYLKCFPKLAGGEHALDLVYAEFLLREQLGEVPDVGEYTRRFPDLGEEFLRQVELHRAMGTNSSANSATPAADRRTVPAAERDGVSGLVHAVLSPPQGPDELGRLGTYRVLRLLGTGAMGAVFLAEDLTLRRAVALKVMKPALAERDTEQQRFLREARAAAALDHDHIVHVYQVGQERGVPFLAMQLLRGETLDARLRRQSRLPVAEVLRIGREAAEGLAAAHTHGLIHRDIKPANLWLEGECGRVKLLDFGLARPANDSDRLTQKGAIVGTPAYMAPVQARNSAVDPRSDLFSLGAVLYEMAAGRRPFQGPDMLSVLYHLAVTVPPPLRQLNPEVPQALKNLVAALLSKELSGRPPSARAVADALAAIEAGKSPDMPTKLPPSRRRRRLLSGAAAVLFLGLASAGFHLGDLSPQSAAPGNASLPDAGTSATVRANESPVSALTRGELFVESADPELNELLDRTPLTLRVLASGERRELAPGRRHTVPAAYYLVEPLRGARRVRFTPHAFTVPWNGKTTLTASFLSESELDRFDETTYEHRALAVSPDGRLIASAGEGLRLGEKPPLPGRGDNTIHLWDAETGVEFGRCEGHQRSVDHLHFSPVDGRYLVSVARDGTIRLWDVSRRKEINRFFVLEKGFVCGVHFSPDGLRVLAWSQDAQPPHYGLTLWDIGAAKPLQGDLATLQPRDQLKPVQRHRYESENAVWAWVAQSPDGQHFLCSNGPKGVVRLCEVATGAEVRRFQGSVDFVSAADFSHDGRYAVTGGCDRFLRLWDVATGLQLHCFPRQPTFVCGAAFTPDGQRVVAASGRAVSIWQVPGQ